MTISAKDLNYIPLAECSRAWQIARKTIIWAYWHDKVEMYKVGNTWLVSWPQMVLHFGQPRRPIKIEQP